MKGLVATCFYFPLITNLLNVQGFISLFISETTGQVFAYINTALLLIGIMIIFKKTKGFAPLIKLWLAFFVCYYAFAILANSILETEPQLLRTLVPLIFFISYSFLLSNPEQQVHVSKVLAFAFLTSSFLLIYLNYLNFSMDSSGISQFRLDRAGGVYGDANNAAVSSILAFIFLRFAIHPKNKLQKKLKLLAMLTAVWALLLTFSNTGVIVFLIVLALCFPKFFSKTRILFAIVFIPIALIVATNWASKNENLSKVQRARIDNVVNILTLETEKVKLSSRDVLFKNMMETIYDNPIIGNGVDHAVLIRGHNTIFGIWADAGIFTFIVFLSLLFLYFKKAFLAKPHIRFYTLSILVTLTLFMLSLQTIINQGYLLVVFSLAAYLLVDKQKNNVNITV